MLARDAWEDKLVRRGRTEHAVADDGEAGMRALGDAVAAVEHDFVAARGFPTGEFVTFAFGRSFGSGNKA